MMMLKFLPVLAQADKGVSERIGRALEDGSESSWGWQRQSDPSLCLAQRPTMN